MDINSHYITYCNTQFWISIWKRSEIQEMRHCPENVTRFPEEGTWFSKNVTLFPEKGEQFQEIVTWFLTNAYQFP